MTLLLTFFSGFEKYAQITHITYLSMCRSKAQKKDVVS